ncbi:hypothetical protein FXN61_29265 [Lentzea sp. PSKA42]|uniref:LigA protein n=1 Tax=Lentzea indica TaxID=2604800 RepID=A0ABX1FP17_9PSEU|nr:hypothetical protein [Lentzea indica]NKE60660.1 hypothetical protein [Lentzea indica]
MGVRRRLTAALAAAVVASTCAASPAGAAGSDPVWRLAPIPGNKATSNLWDVTAVDATHAWAVGIEGYDPEQQYTTGDPMILQWNGNKWSRAPLPAVRGNVSFQRVAASSATDVWVTGGPRSHDVDDNVTLVWHYDGATWTEVPYPAGATPSRLTIRDLSVVDGRAWLVGYQGNTPVFHEWTGGAWREHQPPAECVMGGFPNFCTINAVKAFAADDVWAAGNGMWNGFMGPLLFHWNGTAWRAVQVGLNQQPVSLQSLDGLSSKDIWAVGDSSSGGGNVVVRGDGTTWQQVGGLNSPRTPGVAVGAAPWVLGNYPRASFNTHGPAGWTTTPAPAPAGTLSATYNAIAAVPGTNRMIAVGNADVPGTSPLRLQAVIAEYTSCR